MRCHEAQRQLDQLGKIDESSELVQHLNTCADCRDYARERHLVSVLASLPVRQPAPGFEDRVITNALRRTGTTRVHTRWAMATAASVLLAVFLTIQYFPGSEQPNSIESVQSTVVEVQPLQTRNVNLLLRSPREMSDTLVKVQLDKNLELDGYQGVHNLEWRTTLKDGANRLTLPIRLLDKNSGTVTVLLEHEGASKRFSIQVNAKPNSNSGQKTLTMA